MDFDFPPLPTHWPDRPVARVHPPLKAPKAPGVYVLKLDAGLYVGSSKDLRKRLRYWQTKLGALPAYGFILTQDYRYQEQRFIEKILKRKIPLANKRRAVQKKLFRRLTPTLDP